jgi:hypothetical protein
MVFPSSKNNNAIPGFDTSVDSFLFYLKSHTIVDQMNITVGQQARLIKIQTPLEESNGYRTSSFVDKFTPVPSNILNLPSMCANPQSPKSALHKI